MVTGKRDTWGKLLFFVGLSKWIECLKSSTGRIRKVL